MIKKGKIFTKEKPNSLNTEQQIANKKYGIELLKEYRYDGLNRHQSCKKLQKNVFSNYSFLTIAEWYQESSQQIAKKLIDSFTENGAEILADLDTLKEKAIAENDKELLFKIIMFEFELIYGKKYNFSKYSAFKKELKAISEMKELPSLQILNDLSKNLNPLYGKKMTKNE